MLAKQPFVTGSDVYALGIVLYEILSRALPYEDLNDFEIAAAVVSVVCVCWRGWGGQRST